MLHTANKFVEYSNPIADSEDKIYFDVDRILSAIRRQIRIIMVTAIAFAVLGTVYVLTAVPIYNATVSVLLDANNQKIVDQMLPSISGTMYDETAVMSQVEVIKSKRITQAVMDKLDLVNNKNLMSAKHGMIHTVLSALLSLVNAQSWFAPEAEASIEERNTLLLNQMIDTLKVSRLDRTYVLQISYPSPYPELSAQIANAYAEAYITDQLDSKYDATRRASDWLQNRISELRAKSLSADMAVQKFREEKGLISTAGELLTDQKLTQINSQLILAQSDAANAEARYKSIKAIIDSGQMDSSVTDALTSGITSSLREKFLDASRREADISRRLGANHAQAVRLRTEMSEYRRLIFEELTRIAETYRSTLDTATSRVQQLQQQVQQATSASSTANNSQVQLRELERESETYRNLYQTFLQRYQEAVQQQSFPVTEARVISKAGASDDPISPKMLLIIAAATVIGFSLGCVLGIYREFRDRFFRTGDQVRENLGVEFLGTVLALPEAKRPRSSLEQQDPRHIAKFNGISNYVIDHPLSSFAETIRSAKIAVDVFIDSKECKVVGIVSTLPGEGKSTIAINTAELLAKQGNRVLLIDADLRNPGATRQIGRHGEKGLLELLDGSARLAEVALINPITGLDFVPATIKQRIPYSSELLGSHAMGRVIQEASHLYDYIIIDLPPLGAVVDARAISRNLDCFLLVVEWGRTARNVVRKTFLAEGDIAAKCAGAILNKVDSKKMKFYETFGSKEYYRGSYASYYTE